MACLKRGLTRFCGPFWHHVTYRSHVVYYLLTEHAIPAYTAGQYRPHTLHLMICLLSENSKGTSPFSFFFCGCFYFTKYLLFELILRIMTRESCLKNLAQHTAVKSAVLAHLFFLLFLCSWKLDQNSFIIHQVWTKKIRTMKAWQGLPWLEVDN